MHYSPAGKSKNLSTLPFTSAIVATRIKHQTGYDNHKSERAFSHQGFILLFLIVKKESMPITILIGTIRHSMHTPLALDCLTIIGSSQGAIFPPNKPSGVCPVKRINVLKYYSLQYQEGVKIFL